MANPDKLSIPETPEFKSLFRQLWPLYHTVNKLTSHVFGTTTLQTTSRHPPNTLLSVENTPNFPYKYIVLQNSTVSPGPAVVPFMAIGPDNSPVFSDSSGNLFTDPIGKGTVQYIGIQLANNTLYFAPQTEFIA